MKMMIYDVLHKEKVYRIVSDNLRTLGVKYRIKKNAVKTDKPERNASVLKKVFKTPLSYLPLDVVNLSSGAIIHVPIFVSQAADFILKNVSQEGLFRKAGSQARQKEIIARLDNGGQLGDKNNIIDIANCLKTFFRLLPEPLIPYVYHDLFVRCNMLKTEKVDALLMACVLLPPHHLNTLAFLMEFLKKVASYEKQNKMNIDNIARVFGPNIMPLQETTMLAVQSRLDAHLNIIKLLIENAEKIGILPNDISEAISMDAIGSIDNELDKSDLQSSFKRKMKKHRSGSLTRMLSGLKKMVGKNDSYNGMNVTESHLLSEDSTQSLYTLSLKNGKKRKVADSTDSLNVKKKQDYFEVIPMSVCFGFEYLNSPLVSNNPNPAKNRSPNQKSGVQKYLSQKVHSETRVHDKFERPKKHRLSLDRFVPRNKPKITEKGMELRKKSFSPCTESRWSEVSNTSDSKKRRRTKSIDSSFLSSPQAKIRNSRILDEVFMEADVNLSDDCIPQDNFTIENKPQRIKRVSSARSTHSYSLRNSPNISSTANEVDVKEEEYVKIPKSEYEEIKYRVSAIENRISQEFKSITSDKNDGLTVNPINKVQSEYEKTLVESNIENTASADQLAKRLSRDLKIRRSAEHRIIRSPSARKIGTIRRRSQEKPVSRKILRTASWHHSSDRPYQPNINSRSNNYYPKQCNLKRGRPLVKQNSYKSLDQTPKTPKSPKKVMSFCSEETDARLNYLQEQLNTLINQTAEHTRGSFSDDDFALLENNYVFQSAPEYQPTSTKLTTNQTIRRASSFHSTEFVDNSYYFNNKIKELKKTNSQQNLSPTLSKPQAPAPQYPNSNIKLTETKKEKTVSWKDADDYLKQETKTMTPVPTTGRASVAKLRTQNAGMVLAKAKLFDDTTKEIDNLNRRQSIKIQVSARSTLKEDHRSPHGNKRHNEAIVRRKQSNAHRRSPTVSPLIKMEVTVSSNGRQQSTRFNTPRNKSHEEIKTLQKENQLIKSNENSFTNKSIPENSVNLYKPEESPMCRTPLIKRPLNIKTPKSAKQLSARRSSLHPRRTPLKAVMPITPKRQSPRIVMKSTNLSRHMN